MYQPPPPWVTPMNTVIRRGGEICTRSFGGQYSEHRFHWRNSEWRSCYENSLAFEIPTNATPLGRNPDPLGRFPCGRAPAAKPGTGLSCAGFMLAFGSFALIFTSAASTAESRVEGRQWTCRPVLAGVTKTRNRERRNSQWWKILITARTFRRRGWVGEEKQEGRGK